MPVVVNILLKNATDTSIATSWQQNNAVQFVGNDIHICIAETDNQSLFCRKVQQAARKVESLGVVQAKLIGDNWNLNQQWAFALGFTCVGKLTNVEFTGDAKTVQLLHDKLHVYAWSRTLTHQTPADLFPLKLAQSVTEFIQTQCTNQDFITVDTITGDALVEAGWLGIYNVGKGSCHAPCLLTIDYNPTGNVNAPVAASLVGKGITFDSGGYSIKSSVGMFNMKCDMGGAAVVAGALGLAIKHGLTQRVKLFLCCAENMVSSNAFKLGDIITYKNGVSVEIANTDAEGRLVLADGLLAAAETQSKVTIDAGTLTGASVMATGGDYTALFALDPSMIEQAKHSANKTNEPVWQLPLESWHQDKFPSAFADMANSRLLKGGGAGGASNAAGFLSIFAPNEGQGWLHLDLSASYNGTANNLYAAGATGQGIATIADLLLNLEST